MFGKDTDKHWNIGYVSGSFDMFHVGHLNLIRRAKERCGRLIAGVLTDEIIAGSKKKWPVIPLKDRLEIVGAVKYVDETDVTTPELINKVKAWEKYGFDAMFSGDDHAADGWAWEEAQLKALGADLVFFPYTKEVSSTRLQELTLPPKAESADIAKKVDTFNYVFPFDKVNRAERIVIYGAGTVGAQYIRQLNALSFCRVAAVTDTYEIPGGTFEGVQAVRPDELIKDGGWFDRIVIASVKYHTQILGRLRVLGIPPDRIV